MTVAQDWPKLGSVGAPVGVKVEHFHIFPLCHTVSISFFCLPQLNECSIGDHHPTSSIAFPHHKGGDGHGDGCQAKIEGQLGEVHQKFVHGEGLKSQSNTHLMKCEDLGHLGFVGEKKRWMVTHRDGEGALLLGNTLYRGVMFCQLRNKWRS